MDLFKSYRNIPPFHNELKDSLIVTGAQSNWLNANPSDFSYIANKPTVFPKMYIAKLNGLSRVPVSVNIMYNTLGTINYSSSISGSCNITSAGLFTIGKTEVWINNRGRVSPGDDRLFATRLTIFTNSSSMRMTKHQIIPNSGASPYTGVISTVSVDDTYNEVIIHILVYS